MTTIFKNETLSVKVYGVHSDIEVKRYPNGDVQFIAGSWSAVADKTKRAHTLTAAEAEEFGRVLCASDPMMDGLMDRAAELEPTTAEQKYRILAVALDDGWGLVLEEDEGMFVFSPPYMAKDMVWVRQNEVDNFIHKNGYVACNFVCTTLREVATYLRDAYIDSKSKHEITPPVSIQLTNFLKYASDGTLLWYLQMARDKLIPAGKVSAARRVAADLLRMRRVNDNKTMAGIAKEILRVPDMEHANTPTKGRLLTQEMDSINDEQGVV